MTPEELITTLYARLGQRDREGMLELIAEDVEWVNEPKDIHIRSKDELRALWTKYMDAARIEMDATSITLTDKGAKSIVRERVWNLNGELLFDGPVGHDYVVENTLIRRCDIVDA